MKRKQSPDLKNCGVSAAAETVAAAKALFMQGLSYPDISKRLVGEGHSRCSVGAVRKWCYEKGWRAERIADQPEQAGTHPRAVLSPQDRDRPSDTPTIAPAKPGRENRLGDIRQALGVVVAAISGANSQQDYRAIGVLTSSLEKLSRLEAEWAPENPAEIAAMLISLGYSPDSFNLAMMQAYGHRKTNEAV